MALDKTLVITKGYFDKMDEYAGLIDQMMNNPQFSQEWKETSRKKLLDGLEDARLAAIAEVTPIFDQRINAALEAQKMKLATPEHQVMVSNALRMVELLGDKATASQINNLTAPLIEAGDYHTLDVLKTIVFRRQSPLDPEMEGVNFGESMPNEVNRHEIMKQLVLEALRFNAGNKSNAKLTFHMGMRLYAVPNGYAAKEDFAMNVHDLAKQA